MSARVVLVDQDSGQRAALLDALSRDGYQARGVECGEQALRAFGDDSVDVLIADQSDLSAHGLADALLSSSPSSVCLSLCARQDVPLAVADLNEGRIFQFLYKPYSEEALRALVRDAVACVAGNQAVRNPTTGWVSRSGFLSRLRTLLDEREDLQLVVAEMTNPTSVLGLLRPEELEQLSQEMAQRVHGALEVCVDLAALDRGLYACVFTDPDSLMAVRTLADALARPVSIGAAVTHVKFRFGLTSQAVAQPQDAEEMLQQAMIALAAIEHEEVALHEFTPGLRANLHYRFSLEQDLHDALRRQEFFCLLQPKVDATTTKVRGAEMLIRWEHRLYGLVSPLDFIDLAERSGLIRGIGFWVLEQGIEELERLASLAPGVCISVNVSPRQFSQGSLPDDLALLIDGAGFPANRLELEVTESSVVRDVGHARRLLDQFKELGVRISLDDFGTGHSSLAQLHQLPFDVVKFDRAFVMDLERSEPSRILLRHMVALAADLGLETVAEGIETAAQHDICRELGCDLLQGYYFHKPLSRTEFRGLSPAALTSG